MMAIKNVGPACWVWRRKGVRGAWEGLDLHWRHGTTRATTAAHPWGLFNPLALAARRRRRRTLERGDDALGLCC